MDMAQKFSFYFDCLNDFAFFFFKTDSNVAEASLKLSMNLGLAMNS